MFAGLYAYWSLQMPEGIGDAVAIWNLRARFFAFAPDIRTAFAPALGYSHRDYPPLLPGIVALGWRIFGDTPAVPMVLHGLVYLAILWGLRRSLAALVLAGGALLPYAPTQYADLPLALAVLAASRAWQQRNDLTLGLALGLACGIKNEGLLIAICFGGVALLVWRPLPGRAAWGLLPGLALVLAYRAWVGIPNDIWGAPGALSRLLDGSRYGIIGRAWGVGLLTFGGGAIWLALLIAWLTRTRPGKPELGVVLGSILLGYGIVYALTPAPLSWHLTWSLDRLLAQLYPATLAWVLTPSSDSPDNRIGHLPHLPVAPEGTGRPRGWEDAF